MRRKLPPEPYTYFRFKLATLKNQLAFRGTAITAYMLGCQCLYSKDSDKKDRLKQEIINRLNTIDAMARKAESIPRAEQRHEGRDYHFPLRPLYMDYFTHNMRRHFNLEKT